MEMLLTGASRRFLPAAGDIQAPTFPADDNEIGLAVFHVLESSARKKLTGKTEEMAEVCHRIFQVALLT